MAKADIYCSLRNCLRLQIRFANHFCTTTPQLETVEEAMHITNLLFYWMCEQPKIIDELSQRFCECVNDLSSSVTDGTSNDEAAVEEDKEPQADQWNPTRKTNFSWYILYLQSLLLSLHMGLYILNVLVFYFLRWLENCREFFIHFFIFILFLFQLWLMNIQV